MAWMWWERLRRWVLVQEEPLRESVSPIAENWSKENKSMHFIYTVYQTVCVFVCSLSLFWVLIRVKGLIMWNLDTGLKGTVYFKMRKVIYSPSCQVQTFCCYYRNTKVIQVQESESIMTTFILGCTVPLNVNMWFKTYHSQSQTVMYMCAYVCVCMCDVIWTAGCLLWTESYHHIKVNDCNILHCTRCVQDWTSV